MPKTTRTKNEAYMQRAVELSLKGFPAPNPRVGCVIVKGDLIIGEGYHHFAGGPHAEIVALGQAGNNARGSDVYVTLGPCNHHGRTPPCVDALLEAGVKSVRVAVSDPNPVAAGGLTRLKEHGVAVEVGLLSDRAAEANAAWLTAMHQKRPYLILKAAITRDGYIARSNGESKWISSEESRAEAHRLRAEMGAVLVGARTVQIDDPRLTARIEGVVNQPIPLILDPNNQLIGSERVFEEHKEVLQFVSAGKQTGEKQLVCPMVEGEGFDLLALLATSWQMGITGILVEGGGVTIGHFLKAGLFDRIHLFVAPIEFGEGVPWCGNLDSCSVLDGAFLQRFNLIELFSRAVGVDTELVLGKKAGQA